jgi:hypothetical protein
MPVARKNASDPSPFDDEDTTSGGLAFAGWGFATVVALTLGVASWQYAPPRTARLEVARAEVQLPDPTETGSVPRGDRPPVAVPARVVGGDRVSPMPLAADVQIATSRDIDQLRSEVRELQRRLGQAGLSGDGLSRRLDRIEERLTVDPDLAREKLARSAGPGERPDAVRPAAEKQEIAKAEPAKPSPERGEAAKPVEPPKTALERIEAKVAEPPKPAEKVADSMPSTSADKVPAAPDRMIVERIPVPAARPTDVPDPAPVRTARAVPTAPAAAGGDGEGPAVTGTIARTTPIVVGPPPAVAAAPAPPTVAAESAQVAPKGDLLAAPAKSDPSAVAAKGDGFTMPPATMPPSSEPPAAIDLGGYRSLATLRKAWTDLSGRNAELGRGLAPLARLKETEAGIEARLLVGPFPSQTEAAKSCMRLRAAGVNCSVAVYSGQAVIQR